MRVIGVRAWNEGIRYGVIDRDAGDIVWVNANEEHKWLIPESAKNRQAQIDATYAEWRRVMQVYAPVDIVVVKTPEYGRALDIQTSLTLALLAAISLACSHTHVDSIERVYANLKLSSKTVEAYVLGFIQKPAKYWDLKLADALAVALKELK